MSHPATRTRRAPRTGARRFFFGRGPLGCLGRILLFFVALAAAGALALFIAYERTDLPNPNTLAAAQVSAVYFADGSTEIGRISSAANRESVELSKVPVPVQRAFLSAEDRTFYTNRGISPTGIARAVWVGVTGGEQQGGSTITQQYVKNYFLSSDRTYTRKLKEVFLAVKLDQQKSKDEILRDYLNTIYFGRGAYGIQTAAKAYFDKDASQLTPGEGAVLAAIVKGPSLFDPSTSAANLKRNTDRANWILDGMVSQGWLSATDRAATTLPTVIARKAPQVTGGTNGYLVAAAKAELVAKAKLTDEDFERGGLKIVTTIDPDLQAKAVEAVQHFWPDGEQGIHIGLAAVVPGEGSVKAMWGGPDFLKQQFNDATQNAVPGASTFKLFTLTAAVEHGLDTNSSVSGDMPYRPPFSGGRIDNSEGEGSMGRMTLRRATAMSVNTAFARLNVALGPQMTAEVASRMGITVPEVQQKAPSNTLGVTDVTPLQMAGAYATYAANGRFVSPHLVASAKTADGSVSYAADTQGKQVIDPKYVPDLVEALEGVIEHGTATSAVRGRGLTRPAAGKTGTGEHSTSAWFDGFVPQLAASVGMSQLDEKNTKQEMRIDGRAVYGGGIPAKIWARFMVNAMQGQEVKSLPERTGVGQIKFIPDNPLFGSYDNLRNGGYVGDGSTSRATRTQSSSDDATSTSTASSSPDATDSTGTKTAEPTDDGTSTAEPTGAPSRTAPADDRATARPTGTGRATEPATRPSAHATHTAAHTPAAHASGVRTATGRTAAARPSADATP